MATTLLLARSGECFVLGSTPVWVDPRIAVALATAWRDLHGQPDGMPFGITPMGGEEELCRLPTGEGLGVIVRRTYVRVFGS